MWFRVSLLVFCLCYICVLVRASDFRRTKTVNQEGPPHRIYPRTGRLFHADFIRDNQILRSLERSNFMRRGPFSEQAPLNIAQRQQEKKNEQKKHVYINSEKIPIAETKKEIRFKEKIVPPKSVLLKINNVPVINREGGNNHSVENLNRPKRYVENQEATVKASDEKEILDSKSKQEHDVIKEKKQESAQIIVNERNREDQFMKETENKTEELNQISIKANKTDESNFLLNSKTEEPQSEPGSVPEVEKDVGLMRKTVVDDGLKLYPVYRGVKYHYHHPLNERRLVYSPQLTVQMDLPVVSESLPVDQENATEVPQEEGRSRRPFKKLAFPLLLALKLKTAIMLPLILGLISLIAFKGLWSGLTALGIAAALGLKALVVGSTKVYHLPPPPPPHIHHFPPPHEITEYWSRRGDDFSNDYRPKSWT